MLPSRDVWVCVLAALVAVMFAGTEASPHPPPDGKGYQYAILAGSKVSVKLI